MRTDSTTKEAHLSQATDELHRIREALAREGAQWHAAQTSVSRLSPDERRALLLPLGTDPRLKLSPPPPRLRRVLPTAIDWTNINGVSYVSPVTSQIGGTCTVYANAGLIESALLRTRTSRVVVDLAEQANIHSVEGGTGNLGEVSRFGMEVGLPSQEWFPDDYRSARADWPSHAYRAGTNRAFTFSSLEQAKACLVDYGPGVTAMNVPNEFFSYAGGVFAKPGRFVAVGLHEVLVVGYDDVAQCFKAKNTWGPGWGEAGFFRISYSAFDSSCDIGFGRRLLTCEFVLDPAPRPVPLGGRLSTVHAGTQGFGFGSGSDEVRRFQTFVAGQHCGGRLRVTAKLRRTMGTYQAIRMDLYVVQAGVPGEWSLAAGTLDPVGSAFECSTGMLELGDSGLVPGREYAIVLGADSGGRFEWATAAESEALHFGKWNGSAWVDESGLGDGWLRVDAEGVETSIDVVHEASRGFTFGQQSDQLKRFQTFIAPIAAPLTGVDLRVRKNSGTAHSDVTVELYQTSGHAPAGGVLASTTIAAASIGTAFTTVFARLGFPRMEREREYAVVLSQRTLSASTYEWATATARGSASFGKWTGATWVDESGFGDGWLRAWIGPQGWSAGAGPDTTVDLTHSATRGWGLGNAVDELARFQAFRVPATVGFDWYAVHGVAVRVRRIVGSAQSDLVAQLFRTAAGRPTGFPLATGFVPAAEIGATWTTVTAAMPLDYDLVRFGLKPAGTYAVVLSQRVPQAARYEWAAAQVDPGLAFGKWTGSAWVDESAFGDGWLQVFLRGVVGPN
jgi:hypothetical protein